MARNTVPCGSNCVTGCEPARGGKARVHRAVYSTIYAEATGAGAMGRH